MKPSERIRVLVIDDSAFTRRTLVRMLEGSPLIEVAGWARDGEEALRMALETDFDLITLDLEMPRMDGFTFLRIIMARKPTPVMVVSGRSGHQDVFRALDLGAVDFLAKPSLRIGPELQTIEQELIRKVHAIRQLRIAKVQDRIGTTQALAGPSAAPGVPPRVVAIGASTGGPTALMQIFSAFTEPPSCGFIVSQHMPKGFTQSFAARIDRLTVFRAQEAETGSTVEEGMVLVAPGGSHLEFESREESSRAIVVPSVPGDKYAPAVDRMFQSAAKIFGSELLGIVLTGMGDDGRRGAQAIREAGGRVFAESEETAVIFGMPQQVIRAGAADIVAPLGEIPALIQSGRPAS
ncbi:MAG: chemotaxis-specific protein-glutamate methyltransferase CheB [bacterium]|nr:chemotaxis-specific protein-glutamate methyltransferase CheB [bacterium]MCP5071204.1 chemotaxis-specific protein-glutamate methyltransferase CheB [bacterium]